MKQMMKLYRRGANLDPGKASEQLSKSVQGNLEWKNDYSTELSQGKQETPWKAQSLSWADDPIWKWKLERRYSATNTP